jgi:asparagine synthetase B (glutamine-hydrolysing)
VALDRALRIDSEVMLVDDPVKRVDNLTMAWGREARVPFLDHEFIELAAAARRSSSWSRAARACSRRLRAGSCRRR